MLDAQLVGHLRFMGGNDCQILREAMVEIASNPEPLGGRCGTHHPSANHQFLAGAGGHEKHHREQTQAVTRSHPLRRQPWQSEEGQATGRQQHRGARQSRQRTVVLDVGAMGKSACRKGEQPTRQEHDEQRGWMPPRKADSRQLMLRNDVRFANKQHSTKLSGGAREETEFYDHYGWASTPADQLAGRSERGSASRRGDEQQAQQRGAGPSARIGLERRWERA
jgi:hypothetical protein